MTPNPFPLRVDAGRKVGSVGVVSIRRQRLGCRLERIRRIDIESQSFDRRVDQERACRLPFRTAWACPYGGCHEYQMLMEKNPFAGQSQSETIANYPPSYRRVHCFSLNAVAVPIGKHQTKRREYQTLETRPLTNFNRKLSSIIGS